MADNKIIEKVRNLSYEELVEIIKKLTTDEIIELSKVIGYPVFLRKCMGELQHIIPILQDGAAAIIENQKGEILLQRRADDNNWGLPGGCQEINETFEETIIREVKEETNLNVSEKDLKVISVVSGPSRRYTYPNGDTVISNTVLYHITKFSGEIKRQEESKELKYFSLNNLPENQHDPDLIESYIKYKNKI